MSLQSKLL